MTRTGSIGAMKTPISLHAEARSVGAGGRTAITYPVIADCWAQAEESRTQQTSTGSAKLHTRVSFRLRYQADFMAARHITWCGQRFAVTGWQPEGEPARWLTLTAHRHDGSA